MQLKRGIFTEEMNEIIDTLFALKYPERGIRGQLILRFLQEIDIQQMLLNSNPIPPPDARDNQIVSHIIGINALVWIFTLVLESQGIPLNLYGGMFLRHVAFVSTLATINAYVYARRIYAYCI